MLFWASVFGIGRFGSPLVANCTRGTRAARNSGRNKNSGVVAAGKRFTENKLVTIINALPRAGLTVTKRYFLPIRKEDGSNSVMMHLLSRWNKTCCRIEIKRQRAFPPVGEQQTIRTGGARSWVMAIIESLNAGAFSRESRQKNRGDIRRHTPQSWNNSSLFLFLSLREIITEKLYKSERFSRRSYDAWWKVYPPIDTWPSMINRCPLPWDAVVSNVAFFFYLFFYRRVHWSHPGSAI